MELLPKNALLLPRRRVLESPSHIPTVAAKMRPTKRPPIHRKVKQQRMVGENDAREYDREQTVIQTTNPDPEEPSMISPCSTTTSVEETQGGSKMAEAGEGAAEAAAETAAEEMSPGDVAAPLLCFEGCGKRASFGINGRVRYWRESSSVALVGSRTWALTPVPVLIGR